MYYLVDFKIIKNGIEILTVKHLDSDSDSLPFDFGRNFKIIKEEVDQHGWEELHTISESRYLFKYPHYHFDEEVNPIDFPQSFAFLEYIENQAVGKFIEKI
jgi:hypothetical protein